MKKFIVIGNPIKHSLSPFLHNWVFNELNIDASYDRRRIEKSEISIYMNKISKGILDGMNITLPYKNESLLHVDHINPRAKSIGSINHVMFNNGKLIGNNTDWYGFVKSMNKANINLNNRDVILIGGGGVSRAIIFAMIQMGVSRIYLFNRTFSKIVNLSNNIISCHKYNELGEYINDNSIIINCTSIGMNNEKSPINSNFINKSQKIIDIIYTPLKTKLILDAEAIGAQTISGLDMFIYQALASLDLWFGESISDKVNFNNLRNYIESKLC